MYLDGVIPISEHLGRIDNELVLLKDTRLQQNSSLNLSAILLSHLEDGLSTYISIAETTSALLVDQSIAVNALSSQIISLNNIVETNILSLDAGFEKLHAALLDTEYFVLSWAGRSHGWMLASTGVFIIGTLAGMSRWIVICTSIQR